MQDITAEQLAALQQYARRHGRKWKEELRAQWMRASASPTLHQLRNTHGPSWLAKFQLPKP